MNGRMDRSKQVCSSSWPELLNSELPRLLLAARIPLLALGHLLVFGAIYWVGYFVRFEFRIPGSMWQLFLMSLPLVAGLKLLIFYLSGHFHGWWRHVTFSDFVGLGRAATMAMLVLVLVDHFLLPYQIPRSILAMDWGATILVLGTLRSLRRTFREQSLRFRPPADARRVLIFGTDYESGRLAHLIHSHPELRYHVLGLVALGPGVREKRLGHIPVLGTVDDAAGLARERGASEVLIPAGKVEGKLLRKLLDDTAGAGIRVRVIRPLADTLNGDARIPIRDIDIKDLLHRDPVELDDTAIRELIRGKRVLVTGAGGSIGSELCRQLMRFSPSAILLLGRGENRIYEIHRELKASVVSGQSSVANGGPATDNGQLTTDQSATDSGQVTTDNEPLTNSQSEISSGKNLNSEIRPVIANITNEPRMRAVFEEHRPDIVFHAAAHKHVPLMEENVAEAVENNVGGTRIVADLAQEYGVTHFVMISTDKAVNPTSVMGCTKQLAERYVLALASADNGTVDRRTGDREKDPSSPRDKSGLRTPHSELRTRYMVVRFGNVLGSNGSVVPLFQEQIRRGGPITITDERMMRYFMLIPEATQLVLQAAAMGKGGEVFVLDMGEQIRVIDMARDLIRLAGLAPDSVEIRSIGRRPGEKLYEELARDGEELEPTAHNKLLAAFHAPFTLDEARRATDELLTQSRHSGDGIRQLLEQLVAEYVDEMREPPTPQPRRPQPAVVAR